MNLFLRFKIKKELKRFQEFKQNYKFLLKPLKEMDDGSLFCDNCCLRKGEFEHIAYEDDRLVNAGYISKNSQLSKVLSNLFPYEFYFKGFKVNSIEGIFQSLKFKNKKMQRKVLKYSGFNANRIRICADYDWQDEQIVYFQGMPIKRDSIEYEAFVDEMYISLLQNPLFVQALKKSEGKYIVHSMGVEDKTKTLLSRYEFEHELNCLKDYIATKK